MTDPFQLESPKRKKEKKGHWIVEYEVYNTVLLWFVRCASAISVGLMSVPFQKQQINV